MIFIRQQMKENYLFFNFILYLKQSECNKVFKYDLMWNWSWNVFYLRASDQN